jgi:Zn-dependent M16 (insulinase) family peptidase
MSERAQLSCKRAHAPSTAAMDRALQRLTRVSARFEHAVPRALTCAVQVRALSSHAPRPQGALAVGDILAAAWTVSARERIGTLGIDAITLKHPSGALALHLDADDPHVYFSLHFRTAVDNDRGVPHVLEHSVLCGSAKYDVKDPFHLMAAGRSLHTDMNAYTSAALTSFHFSTMNAADWTNLLSVYLDAAFFPRLRAEDFAQEGHRTEPRDSTSAASDLVVRGVVLNEMKGYMSGANEHIARALLEGLLPGTPYAFSHGGDPRAILQLTHAQLTAFHAAHYTPSNALFVTYGDVALEATLADINHQLDKCSPIGGEVMVAAPPAQPSRTAAGLRVSINHAAGPAPGPEIRKVRVPPGYEMPGVPSVGLPSFEGPMAEALEETAQGEMEEGEGEGVSMAEGGPNCTFMRGWAAGDARDVFHNLQMRVLLDLLTYGSESPLHIFLVRAGLAASISPSTGYDASTLQPVLVIGATGVREEDAAAVDVAIEKAIRFSLDPESFAGEEKLPQDPFAADRIHAVLHSLEVALRTRTPAFGSAMASLIADHWALGVDGSEGALAAPLRVEELMVELRLALSITEGLDLHGTMEEGETVAVTAAAKALRALLRKWTLDNAHTVKLLAVPDAALVSEIDAVEAAHVAAAEKAWTPEDRQAAIVTSEAAQARRRAAPAAAAACLPFLPISAVSRVSPVKESMRFRLLEAPAHQEKELVQSVPLAMSPIPIPLQIVTAPTNGLAVLRIVFNMRLPEWAAAAGMPSPKDRHPWYDLQEASPLAPSLLRLPEQLHAWLPLATSFAGYGTTSATPSEWETSARLLFGRMGCSIVTATPTVLPPGTGHGTPILPSLAHQMRLAPSLAAGGHLTAPLYGIALEFGWIADRPRTDAAMMLISQLLTASSVAGGGLRDRDYALFAESLRSASVDAAMNVADSAEGYSRRWASAGMHPLMAVSEVQGGLTQARLLQSVVASGEAGIIAAADACRTTVRAVLQRPFVSRSVLREASGAERGGLDPITASAWPIRAMLTMDGSRATPESFGMGSGGVPLQSAATADLVAHSVEWLLGSLPLHRPAGLTAAPTPRAVLRAAAALPASLRAVKPNSPPLPRSVHAPAAPSRDVTPQRTLLHIPGASSVFTLCVTLPGPPWGTPDHVHLHLACSLLSTGPLHEEIREKGGAYDVSARVSTSDDVVITTGDDPTPFASLAAIREGTMWAANGAFSDADVDAAKLTMFGEVDAPVGPEGQGLSGFMYGVTPAARQAYRDWIFAATREGVASAASKWLCEPLAAGTYAVTIAGDAPTLRVALAKSADLAPTEWAVMEVLK